MTKSGKANPQSSPDTDLSQQTMKQIHKTTQKYDWECEIFKNKDNIIQVNFVEQWVSEIHLHLNKTFNNWKFLKQPQKVKSLNKYEQDLFLGHTNALPQVPTVALLVRLLQMS